MVHTAYYLGASMGIQGIRSHECEVCAKQILELPGACAHGTYCAREIFAHAQSLVKSHFY